MRQAGHQLSNRSVWGVVVEEVGNALLPQVEDRVALAEESFDAVAAVLDAMHQVENLDGKASADRLLEGPAQCARARRGGRLGRQRGARGSTRWALPENEY